MPKEGISHVGVWWKMMKLTMKAETAIWSLRNVTLVSDITPISRFAYLNLHLEALIPFTLRSPQSPVVKQNIFPDLPERLLVVMIRP